MIKENGTILIPIDFSRYSMVGLMNSYNIARYTKSKILLLNIIKQQEDVDYMALQKLCNKVKSDHWIPCDYINVFETDVFNKILKVSNDSDISLIIMGLNPELRFSNFLGFGKYSNFIKKLKCPIITCRSIHFTSGCETIIMPLDLSPESREKVGATVQVAKFYDAEVKVVSVFSPKKPIVENRLLPYLHQVKKIIGKQQLFCSNKSIASENITESILTYANKNKADLIVQMNERNTNIFKWMKGSDSMRIIDNTEIPVLTINPIKRRSISTGIH